MRNSTLTATVVAIAVLALTIQPASADASRKESIGVGAGAIVGAFAGGPVGFIIGAAIGGKLGDSAHKKSERIGSLQSSLEGKEQAVATLEANVDELNAQVMQLQRIAKPELISLMQAGIDMDLLFRTDEYALINGTGDRVSQLASTLASMPGVRIQLDGFADERGDAAYNQDLSAKRVDFVRQLFVDAGVSPKRISATAHGESPAQNPDVDSYALERRVSVKLFIDNAASLASNQH